MNPQVGHNFQSRDSCKSLQALEAVQNPRQTAKKTTATRNLNLKLTHAREAWGRGHQILCKSLRTRQLEIECSSLGTGVAKTLLGPSCKQSMLKQPNQSAISWNRAIKNSRKNHRYRENSVMPGESLRPALLSRVTQCTPK